MTKASRYYKLALSLAAFLGIIMQMGLLRGSINLGVFRYFTILSNFLVMVYYYFLNLHPTPKRRWLKGAIMMCITVTGLVYHLLLARGPFAMSFERDAYEMVANWLLHTAVPVMTVLDWVFFDEKPAIKRCDPLTWCILPDIYLVVFLLRGLLIGTRVFFGSKYPYFFMDLELLGVGGVLKYVLGLHGAFILLGYLFYGLDKVLSKRKNSTRI